MRLAGKVALISGGARGMGAAAARLFAREGARVVIGDVLEAEGRAVEADVRAKGGEAVFARLDVTSEAEWQQAVEVALRHYGTLNVLINNAGIGGAGRLEDTSAEAWDRVMDVNAKGVFLGSKAVIPAMRQAGGGSIVNISSVAGLVADRTLAGYCASKGAVRMLSKSIALHGARSKVRCNSVHPSFIDTPMVAALAGELGSSALDKLTKASPMGRLGTADEVAMMVVYLASDEASFVTGAELVVDGGLTAR
jgi:NAD(P)-dependent dehydrogenase (short-subunit alcohol dehydrogenase family)